MAGGRNGTTGSNRQTMLKSRASGSSMKLALCCRGYGDSSKVKIFPSFLFEENVRIPEQNREQTKLYRRDLQSIAHLGTQKHACESTWKKVSVHALMKQVASNEISSRKTKTRL